MKAKTAKQSKKSNRSLKVKDLEPKQTPKGGAGGSRPERCGTDLNHNETLVSDPSDQRNNDMRRRTSRMEFCVTYCC